MRGTRGLTTGQDTLIACSALALGTILLLVGAYSRRSGYPPPLLLMPPLLLACTSLLLRRTKPLLGLGLCLIAVIADVLLGPSLAAIIILTDLLYSACLYGPRRAVPWLTAGCCAVTAVLTLAALAQARTLRDTLLTAVYAGLVILWPPLTGVTVRRHRDQAATERMRAESARRDTELERQRSVALERARVASDIHDIISNHLSAIALQSTAALSLARQDNEKYLTALKLIRQNSLEGVDEMRRMVAILLGGEQPPPDSPVSMAVLRRLIERMGQLGTPARLRVVGEQIPLLPEVETAAYRIVQESLTNVLKHAHGADVDTVVEYHDDRIVITVDSGLPAPGVPSPIGGNGFGLYSMHERAERVGGSCTARPEGSRWRVRAELPATPSLAPEDGATNTEEATPPWRSGSLSSMITSRSGWGSP